eukprot:g11990.t1
MLWRMIKLLKLECSGQKSLYQKAKVNVSNLIRQAGAFENAFLRFWLHPRSWTLFSNSVETKMSAPKTKPTYLLMVQLAIKDMRKTKGSGRAAVKNWIETKYGSADAASMRAAFKKGVADGLLTQEGQKFHLTAKAKTKLVKGPAKKKTVKKKKTTKKKAAPKKEGDAAKKKTTKKKTTKKKPATKKAATKKAGKKKVAAKKKSTKKKAAKKAAAPAPTA